MGLDPELTFQVELSAPYTSYMNTETMSQVKILLSYGFEKDNTLACQPNLEHHNFMYPTNHKTMNYVVIDFNLIFYAHCNLQA